MTALIIIASIILVILFLLTRYAGIIIVYRDDLTVTVTYGLIRYRLGKKRPQNSKEKKRKRQKRRKRKRRKFLRHRPTPKQKKQQSANGAMR